MYTNEELAEYCPGLSLFTEFITEQEELDICAEIDSKQWDNRLSRRVQHYGFEFDYATRMAINNGQTNSFTFPSTCNALLTKFRETVAQAAGEFDQLTVNEYLPGQGIAPHVDSHSCFGDCMLSISLMASICIRFVPKSSSLLVGARRVNVWLSRRSLLVMQGPSRLAYSHHIPARKSDLVDGIVVPRVDRRVSLTFRSVRFPPACTCSFPDTCEMQDLVLEPTRIAPRRVD